MLRSHSTAMVSRALTPLALRQLAAGDAADDVLLVSPAITYRRDAIDWQHTGTPHQLDLWRISRRPLGQADLDQMVAALLAALVPGLASRAVPRQHPYTRAGRQVDVQISRSWVEVAECGLAEPRVLAQAGLRDRSGLALGMGLDRLLMLRKGIPEIRLLRAPDAPVPALRQDRTPY